MKALLIGFDGSVKFVDAPKDEDIIIMDQVVQRPFSMHPVPHGRAIRRIFKRIPMSKPVHGLILFQEVEL